jgi:hypothetical protein
LVGTEGFQPYLIIGMIETTNRKALRKAVVSFMDSVKKDPLYNSIPSVKTDKGWFVHARGDHPEIRAKFFLYLSQRGNNSLHRFQTAVDKALSVRESNEKSNIKFNLEIVASKEMPELSIIDYLIWALQRKLITGESSYFDAMESKYSTVMHLYDGEK